MSKATNKQHTRFNTQQSQQITIYNQKSRQPRQSLCVCVCVFALSQLSLLRVRKRKPPLGATPWRRGLATAQPLGASQLLLGARLWTPPSGSAGERGGWMWRWEVAMWGMSGSGACLKVRAVGVGKSVGQRWRRRRKGEAVCVCARVCGGLWRRSRRQCGDGGGAGCGRCGCGARTGCSAVMVEVGGIPVSDEAGGGDGGGAR